ncbi:hypothetical protein [Reichenbachiella sp.]|uniref:hypothetical protein n=1 Tax=Reichenbachiella sp. TaxID=2184521 RepID=UPI003B5A848D
MKSIFFISLTSLIVFSSCSIFDNEYEEHLILTFEGYTFYEPLMLITDVDGRLLDSARITKEVTNFYSNRFPEKITASVVYRFDNFIDIRSYFHIKTGDTLNTILPETAASSSINLDVDDILTPFVVHGNGVPIKSYDVEYSANDPVELSSESSLSFIHYDGKKMYFNIFENISTQQLRITLEDLEEMAFQKITSPQTWYLSAVKVPYANSKIMHNAALDPIFYNDGLFYPKDFDYYLTKFTFPSEDPKEHYNYNIYGEIPSSIQSLDIGEISLPQSASHFHSSSSNPEVDVVITQMGDADHLNLVKIIGPNDENLATSELVDLVKEIYPENNFNVDILEIISLYDYKDISYDEFIDQFSGNEELELTHQRYTKYY